MSSISILENAEFISICGGFHSDNLVWCHGNAGFKDSARSRRGKSALDYSKSVIVNDTVFIDSKPAIVDSDEYSEMMRNMDIIVREILKYVDEYVSFCNNESLRISEEEFARRYRFSTLKYFHEVLGISASAYLPADFYISNGSQ